MRLFKYPNGYWYIEFARGNKKSLKTKNRNDAKYLYDQYYQEHLHKNIGIPLKKK